MKSLPPLLVCCQKENTSSAAAVSVIFFVLWARFRFMNISRDYTPAAYTRGGAWNDEDKSAPGFFIIQRIIISCSRMAKGGIHPRIGLQSVMTGYCFLVNIIILLVLIRQIRGHYDADVLHHHGGRQCSHQHPKAHEVRSDYDFTYHSIVVVCDFTNFVHAWGNFLLKIWSCHMSRRNITRQSTQITK